MDGSGSQALGLRFRSGVRIADCLHAAPGHGYWQLDLGVSQNQGYHFGVPRISIVVFWVYIGVPLFWETTISAFAGAAQDDAGFGP